MGAQTTMSSNEGDNSPIDVDDLPDNETPSNGVPYPMKIKKEMHAQTVEELERTHAANLKRVEETGDLLEQMKRDQKNQEQLANKKRNEFNDAIKADLARTVLSCSKLQFPILNQEATEQSFSDETQKRLKDRFSEVENALNNLQNELRAIFDASGCHSEVMRVLEVEKSLHVLQQLERSKNGEASQEGSSSNLQRGESSPSNTHNLSKEKKELIHLLKRPELQTLKLKLKINQQTKITTILNCLKTLEKFKDEQLNREIETLIASFEQKSRTNTKTSKHKRNSKVGARNIAEVGAGDNAEVGAGDMSDEDLFRPSKIPRSNLASFVTPERTDDFNKCCDLIVSFLENKSEELKKEHAHYWQNFKQETNIWTFLKISHGMWSNPRENEQELKKCVLKMVLALHPDKTDNLSLTEEQRHLIGHVANAIKDELSKHFAQHHKLSIDVKINDLVYGTATCTNGVDQNSKDSPVDLTGPLYHSD